MGKMNKFPDNRDAIAIHDTLTNEFMEIPPGRYATWREALDDLGFQVVNGEGFRAADVFTGSEISLDTPPTKGQRIVWGTEEIIA